VYPRSSAASIGSLIYWHALNACPESSRRRSPASAFPSRPLPLPRLPGSQQQPPTPPTPPARFPAPAAHSPSVARPAPFPSRPLPLPRPSGSQPRARRVELQIAHRARARFHRRHLAETPRQRQRETVPRPRTGRAPSRPPRLRAPPPPAGRSGSRFTWKNELLLTRNSPR
jgi:hypothetical protein